MINRETVIKGLECCAGQCNYHGCPYKDPCENANGVKQIMLDALTLLKEQEAAKPKCKERMGGLIVGLCPTCGTALNNVLNVKACGKCGQKVKWE